MNILVTGSAGFLGKNLVENLKNIRDGKNRTRPDLVIDQIFEYDKDGTVEKLEAYCKDAGFIFHCAGVNRPKDTAEFMEGNFGFTSKLLNILRSCASKAPLVITSSVQAALAGRFGDSEYGRSKLAGEELLFRYSVETGVPVYVYRFPNLVGKWGRPEYNSAVITFCHHIANGLQIRVDNPDTELELLFVEDLLEEFYDCLEGHPHRCEYPGPGKIINHTIYDGVTPTSDESGKYCYCPITFKATLGYIVELLNTYHSESIKVPTIPKVSFEYRLYAMYLSYLPKDKVAMPLAMNVDGRGNFAELIHTEKSGQISINVTKPGLKKGEHWHNNKNERFIVVSGHGLIQMRQIGSDEIWEFEVSGDKFESVIMLPGYCHNLINLSDTQDLVTVMWASEIHDPDRPDTYREMVVRETEG